MSEDRMKKTGASLTVYALEQIGVTHTFGIPGLQNTEIYDELNSSEKITPILVTHEGGASFMADAVSRTSSSIGTIVIVPSAGVTHAMSGIGEAYLDGIPMLIISGGVRRDTGKSYQLHQWDQHRLLEAATKKTWLIKNHDEIIPAIYKAYTTAISGEPGPVFIEIPVEIQIFKGEVKELPVFSMEKKKSEIDLEKIRSAAKVLVSSKKPGMFLGWGCKDAGEICVKIAEILACPVSTTLQGLSVFPASHPLHTGMGFGPSAVPCAENAFKDCDCLLAVGTRFGEIPTGSFGVKVPDNLIHVDINPEVFGKNYPAKIAIQGDAGEILELILAEIKNKKPDTQERGEYLKKKISKDKHEYAESWKNLKTDLVNPALFFEALRRKLGMDDIIVVDDGNHTFLAAELFPVLSPKSFISPSDFNCMGYCVPAAIGAKIANPEKKVAGIVGDGAFLMTCMEILTAATLNAGIVYFVFHDGELAQIAQGQQIPYNRKTCSILGEIKLQGIAMATGAAFLEMKRNEDIEAVIDRAFSIAETGQPVIADVRIDYSKKTRFTSGVVSTVLKRFPLGDKFRFIGRAVMRKITG